MKKKSIATLLIILNSLNFFYGYSQARKVYNSIETKNVLYFKVEEIVKMSFGGTTTKYTVSNLSLISDVNLGPNNVRIITPVYKDESYKKYYIETPNLDKNSRKSKQPTLLAEYDNDGNKIQISTPEATIENKKTVAQLKANGTRSQPFPTDKNNSQNNQESSNLVGTTTDNDRIKTLKNQKNNTKTARVARSVNATSNQPFPTVKNNSQNNQESSNLVGTTTDNDRIKTLQNQNSGKKTAKIAGSVNATSNQPFPSDANDTQNSKETASVDKGITANDRIRKLKSQKADKKALALQEQANAAAEESIADDRNDTQNNKETARVRKKTTANDRIRTLKIQKADKKALVLQEQANAAAEESIADDRNDTQNNKETARVRKKTTANDRIKILKSQKADKKALALQEQAIAAAPESITDDRNDSKKIQEPKKLVKRVSDNSRNKTTQNQIANKKVLALIEESSTTKGDPIAVDKKIPQTDLDKNTLVNNNSQAIENLSAEKNELAQEIARFIVEESVPTVANETKREGLKSITINIIDVYERVAEKGYKSVFMFKELGNNYLFKNDMEKAVKWYEHLFAMTNDLEPIYYLRFGVALKKVGKTKRGEAMIEKFEELDK